MLLCVITARRPAPVNTKPRLYQWANDDETFRFIKRRSDYADLAESVLRNYVRPKLRLAKLGWINFAVLRRSHSTLHKQRNSDLKIIADQQGHGMRTHLENYVQSAVTERKAEAAKLYADFTGLLHKRG